MIKILICGAAYSEKEEMFKHPFVGESGRELARMLHDAGIVPPLPHKYPSEMEMIKYWKNLLSSHKIALTTVFKCHPPKNNSEEMFFTSAKEGDRNVAPLAKGKYAKIGTYAHVETLWKEILALRPNLIITLGNIASWAVTGSGGITAMRGTICLAERLGIKVLPTYHPEAILKQWNWRVITVADLAKAGREAEFPEIRRIERKLLINPSIEEIEAWAELPAEIYSVDIETSIKQISMISFARTPYDVLHIPFHRKVEKIEFAKYGETAACPNMNYWVSARDEVKVWKLVQKLLAKPIPKLFQNGIYDLSYLLRAGMRPRMCNADTMLLHHSLYPEMQKGLGFLGSIYANEIAWKGMRTASGNKNSVAKRDE